MPSDGVKVFSKLMCVDSVRKSLNVHKSSYFCIFFCLNTCFLSSVSVRPVDNGGLKKLATFCPGCLLFIFFYLKVLK